MKKNNTEVMEVEAEEMLPETSLDKQIENALVKENITDKVIRQLKETFVGMALKSIDDKESYLDIKKARTEVRRIGILVEKVCKKGREDAVAIQRKWLNKEKEVLSQISEVQDPLDAEIKKFEDEVARKENEEKQRREESFMARQASLFKYGAEYRNGNYELAELSYESELIKNAEDEMWEGVILPKFRKVYEQKEAAMVAEETRRREEMERQEKERIELEEKQAAFRKEQEEFERQKRELQEQKDKQDREIREAEEKRQAENIRKRNELIEGRINQLRALGMTFNFNYDAYVFEDVNVDNKTELCLFNEKEWSDLIAKITPAIEEKKIQKEEAETRRKAGKARFEILKDMGFETETEVNLSTLTDEHWQSMYAGYRKAYDAKKQKEWEAQQKLKKQLEDEQKQKELDAANDKTRYEDVVKYLSDYPAYEMKSNIYKKRMNIIKDFIADLKEN